MKVFCFVWHWLCLTVSFKLVVVTNQQTSVRPFSVHRRLLAWLTQTCGAGKRRKGHRLRASAGWTVTVCLRWADCHCVSPLGGLSESGWDLPGAQGLVHSSVVPISLVCVLLLHLDRKLWLGKKSFKSWGFWQLSLPSVFGGSAQVGAAASGTF